MLVELAVRDLGVIADLSLVFGPGMTALTGETGAGKTLLVEAIELLVGARADPVLVRPGAPEARVEGRFLLGGDEVVLARVLPRDGRSRAYVDGRLATAGTLAELGRALVDLHGQHTHQSLLSPPAQRAVLDGFAGVDLSPLQGARARVTDIDVQLAALGGDQRARAREIDLLRHQLSELEAAALTDPDEDARLDAEEDALADAVAHREAAAVAVEALIADGGARDGLAAAFQAVSGRSPFAPLAGRLEALLAEAADVSAEIRTVGEAIEDDPERLASVRGRRQLFRDLRRKYGETLADVMAYAADASARLAELTSHGARVEALERARADALDALVTAASAVGEARRAAGPTLATAVEAHLADLALRGSTMRVEVGDDPGDDLAILLSSNPGMPPLPLAKIASGGELARVMLALRLVMTRLDDDGGPATLVFDEVDAGVGGETAVAVGRALAAVATRRQVLVVTHLPQVAAFADAQVAVAKAADGAATVATARHVDGEARLVELSRMLSGTPDSIRARDHAAELLAAAAAERVR